MVVGWGRMPVTPSLPFHELLMFCMVCQWQVQEWPFFLELQNARAPMRVQPRTAHARAPLLSCKRRPRERGHAHAQPVHVHVMCAAARRAFCASTYGARQANARKMSLLAQAISMSTCVRQPRQRLVVSPTQRPTPHQTHLAPVAKPGTIARR